MMKIKNRWQLKALLIALIIPSTVNAQLIITEYVEGGSLNKAIELSNISGVELDLTGYSVTLYSNGALTATDSLALTGTLAAQSALVIYNRGAENEFKILDGVESNVASFNGDDALLLTLGDSIVDSFGQYGTDPGSSWSSGNFNTKDKTLRRTASTIEGDNIPSDEFPGISLSQWVVFDKDTSDGLGCIGELACVDVERVPEVSAEDDICSNCPTIDKIVDSATYDESAYYLNALIAADDDLRSSINQDISKDHKKLTYSEVWTVLTNSDEDPNDSGKVIEIYSGRSIGKGLNAGLIGNSGDAWNREHVWAKSHGFPSDSQYAFTDAHHLRPADASINSERGNLDFDEGGVALTEAPENFKDNDSFEPRDEVKGDVARMLFYMDVRYSGAVADNTPDLLLVDYVGTSTDTAELGKLCTLYSWHNADPVSTWEQNRNNIVYEFQGNRNPFIDHPEWIKPIFGEACGDGSSVVNLAPAITIDAATTANSGEVVTISTNVIDPENDLLTYFWTQESALELTFNETSNSLIFTAPEVDIDTVATFNVVVSDGVNDVQETISMTILATIEASTEATDNTEVNEATEIDETKKSNGGSAFLFPLLILIFLRKKYY